VSPVRSIVYTCYVCLKGRSHLSAFAAIDDSASGGLPDRPASPAGQACGSSGLTPPHVGGRLDLGFLGSRLFRREVPDGRCWILLDLLGFSRPNRDFSMGYAAFSQAAFFARRVPRDCPPRHDGGPRSRHAERRGCSWVKSLPIFRIFCKRLSSGHALSGPGDAQRPARGGCLQFVIPAQAGIQRIVSACWTPAFAGMIGGGSWPEGRPSRPPSLSRRPVFGA